MKTFIIGLVVAVIGALALWFGGIPYTDRTEVLDIGDIEASVEQDERLDIAPLVGGAILVVGLGIMVYGAAAQKKL